ncbi:D-aspartate oxidase [Nasonia vitripennis]|uniref:FAD dependent oxidoreductase domain-containing protein n=1 Tax=Nasonia vitripennis TaxID=7425 RepID=A0A7M7Q4I0_NASVI|nr:D-aspartate oxidase [Nasonia vitripennis]
MKIAVLGGGCVGLTTAVHLQNELRNSAKLDVIAETFDETTSHIAPGIFRIGANYTGPTEEITRKWVSDSYEYYDAINRSPDAAIAGVTNLSGYMYSNNPFEKNPFMEELVPIYRKCTEEELQLVEGGWKYGMFTSTLLTHPTFYLPWVRKRLAANGVNLVTRRVESLKELAKDYDIIINCTGLGAKRLCQDRYMVPISGQIIKAKAPWIKTFFYADLNTYIIPGPDGLITLGGNREYGSYDVSICRHQAAAIRERCEKLVPSLTKAETVIHKNGIRPHREGGIRSGTEKIQDGLHSATVIHNYGHSGYGICTAPGTSKYAVELAKDAHRLA